MIQIYNQDCADILLKFFNDKTIIVTDPPFNINYHYNTYRDKMNEQEYYNWLSNIFKNRKSVVIHYPEQLHKLSINMNVAPFKVISWIYNSNTAKQHRDIAFYNINPSMKQVTQPYKNPNDRRIKERIARGCTGAKLYDWWNINQVKNVSEEKTEHPCQMPLKVMENIIGILPYDAIIIDPFMGSGTTGVAVVNMNKKQNANRSFIGVEIDEKYFKIAQNRLNLDKLIQERSEMYMNHKEIKIGEYKVEE